MSAFIHATGLSYELPDGRRLFSDLNISLSSGLTALVGPNGVGKTTLARLFSGELSPLRGHVHRSVPVTLFAQREPPPPLTVAEYLALDDAWARVEDKRLAGRLLQGIADEALCPTLSGGQWMKVRLARALGEGYLILDEPTNDLDREGREAVLRFLRGHTGGALLISHDRECLELCDETLELSNRGLAKFGGGWSAYSAAREHERENLAQALETAEKERDKAWAARQEQREKQDKRNRRGADSAAKGGQAKILLGARKRAAQATTGKIDTGTLRKAGEAVQGLREAFQDLKIDPVMYADLVGRALPGSKRVAEAIGFNLRYPGQDWLYPRDLDFAWRGNVRIALRGGNGSGKSTLLRAVLGTLPPDVETRGELRAASLEALFLDQRLAGLDDSKTVFDMIGEVSGAHDTEIRNGLARFLFTKETAFQKIGSLSGGERLRAALARGFLGSTVPELLVLDEPTNNLDLANIAFLEKVVAGFQGAVLVISHDETFIENCRLPNPAPPLPFRRSHFRA
jgi:ATPase subunit of ABC transporter with duplicated ATPase domains